MNIQLNFVIFLSLLFGAGLAQAKSTVQEMKREAAAAAAAAATADQTTTSFSKVRY